MRPDSPNNPPQQVSPVRVRWLWIGTLLVVLVAVLLRPRQSTFSDPVVATNGNKSLSARHKATPPDREVDALWPAILDTFGAAQQAHDWPAQKFLDYGQSVLDSLRPGMVYLGGTDSGRWVPALMNTGEGERHVVITQNALMDESRTRLRL